MQTVEYAAQTLARGLFLLAVILGLLLFPRAASAFTPPSPRGAVTDTSRRLTAADDQALEAEIAGYRARTGHELAVLVVGSLGG